MRYKQWIIIKREVCLELQRGQVRKIDKKKEERGKKERGGGK